MTELRTDSSWKPFLGGGDGTDPLATCVGAAFSHDGSWYAGATVSGPVHMLKVGAGALEGKGTREQSSDKSVTLNPTGLSDAATTNIKFRAQAPSTVSNSYIIASAVSTGSVELWNFNPELSSRKVRSIGSAVEEGNETLAVSFAPDGNSLVTGGSDKCIRVYAVGDLTSNSGASLANNVQPLKLVAEYRSGINCHGQDTLGPNNRIFALKHVSSNVFLAAGWETPVLLYDTRIAKSAQGAIRGPHVSGDSLDIYEGHTVVVGSDRQHESQIDVYDLRNLGASFARGHSGADESTKSVSSVRGAGCRVFAARFSPNGKEIWIGGAEDNCVLLYNWNGAECTLKSRNSSLPHPIYTLEHNDKVRPRYKNPGVNDNDDVGSLRQFRCSWIAAGGMGFTVRVLDQ